MKKILGFTLASLALAALSAPSYANYFGRFGGSVRGDVGQLDSQVPYFGIDTIVDSTNYDSTVRTIYSDRKKWNWDFTGRLFSYLNCSPCDPCPIYVAASWQGSDHTTDSSLDPQLETLFSRAIIPVRAHGESGFLQPYGSIEVVSTPILELLPIPILGPNITTLVTTYDTVVPSISVHNEFSKAKLGIGFDLIKTSCFGFTMEVGANYLNAKLTTDKRYDLIVPPTAPSATLALTGIPVAITITAQTGNVIVAPTFSENLDIAPLANSVPSATVPLPYDFVFLIDERDETEGLGLYASIKGEYKFGLGCFGNCFSIYGKAELSDIIGRQRYSYDFSYSDHYAVSPSYPDRRYSYHEEPEHQYNNIVEVDLEAALVYSPCFKCWDELDMSFAIGVRTDSFVNLFSHVTYENNQSIWNLTRPSVFFEVGIKM